MLLKNKCNKGDPCRHTTGMTAANETQDYAVEEQDKPQTLLPIVDYRVDFLEDPSAPGAGEALPGRRDARLHPVAITLTVCGDCPVRLGELLDALCADAAAHDLGLDPADATLRVFELTALALGARRARPSSTTWPTRSRPGTSTPRSRARSASSSATSTCGSCSPSTRSTASARATCRAPLRRRRGAGRAVPASTSAPRRASASAPRRSRPTGATTASCS